MPLLSITTSAPPPKPLRRADILARLSRLVARELDKPEGYVLVLLNAGATISFGGDAESPAAYVEFKNIGEFTPERVAELSRILCAEIEATLAVNAARIYIEFTNSDGALWGWNGETFS